MFDCFHQPNRWETAYLDDSPNILCYDAAGFGAEWSRLAVLSAPAPGAQAPSPYIYPPYRKSVSHRAFVWVARAPHGHFSAVLARAAAARRW